jgi:hypothetical protein
MNKRTISFSLLSSDSSLKASMVADGVWADEVGLVAGFDAGAGRIGMGRGDQADIAPEIVNNFWRKKSMINSFQINSLLIGQVVQLM